MVLVLNAELVFKGDVECLISQNLAALILKSQCRMVELAKSFVHKSETMLGRASKTSLFCGTLAMSPRSKILHLAVRRSTSRRGHQ